MTRRREIWPVPVMLLAALGGTAAQNVSREFFMETHWLFEMAMVFSIFAGVVFFMRGWGREDWRRPSMEFVSNGLVVVMFLWVICVSGVVAWRGW